MQTIDIPIESIAAAPWNPRQHGPQDKARLWRSIERFGFLVPLVVREVSPRRYETVGGAGRLQVAWELSQTELPCIVVTADDAEARLLAEALNRIAGQDDAGLRGKLLRDVLETVPESEVLALLPETKQSLLALTALGAGDLALAIKTWDGLQRVRFQHLLFQLTKEQFGVVQAALRKATAEARAGGLSGPNRRGIALAIICARYLEVEA